MPLRSHRIRLAQPLGKFRIDIRFAAQSKMMDVVAGGNRVDTAEPRVLKPASEHHVAIEPPSA
ncbi:MAG: hypothetical protein ACRELE_02400 [Gemmatimonadales bacterium]